MPKSGYNYFLSLFLHKVLYNIFLLAADNKMAKRILVADDDPAIAEGVVLMLNEYGFDATFVLDGQKVLKLEKNFPDLLLLDVWMSGHDGREICRKLKRKSTTKQIPIILFSASREIKQSAEEAGANDFIEKPFDMDELITKIQRHLN